MIDLAKIKEEPERLTLNIQTILTDIKTLKTTPFYKKHKKIINQAIKLFPELADSTETKDTNKKTYYELLEELQEAIIEDNQERITEIMGSINLTEWATIHEDDSIVFDIIKNQLNHIQSNIQKNNITNKYLGGMLSIMKRSLKRCRDICDNKEDQKQTWKIISIT